MTHGTQTCPSCGGYMAPLGDGGDATYSQCRECGHVDGKRKNSTLDDFINATVNDYYDYD